MMYRISEFSSCWFSVHYSNAREPLLRIRILNGNHSGKRDYSYFIYRREDHEEIYNIKLSYIKRYSITKWNFKYCFFVDSPTRNTLSPITAHPCFPTRTSHLALLLCFLPSRGGKPYTSEPGKSSTDYINYHDALVRWEYSS